MRLQNTTMQEDRLLTSIESSVNDLVLLVERLDREITEWRVAADLLSCNTPDELADKINQLPSS